jgi:hypothetical protein
LNNVTYLPPEPIVIIALTTKIKSIIPKTTLEQQRNKKEKNTKFATDLVVLHSQGDDSRYQEISAMKNKRMDQKAFCILAWYVLA